LFVLAFSKDLHSRLANLNLDDEGRVDWTTAEHGVGVWGVRDGRSLMTRFAEGEVDLPKRDYSDGWLITNNHTVEEAQITNGTESFNLWALFKASFPATRKLSTTAIEARPSMPALTDAPRGPDTLANRRRLIRRVSSNAGNDVADTIDQSQPAIIRFPRRVRQRHSPGSPEAIAQEPPASGPTSQVCVQNAIQEALKEITNCPDAINSQGLEEDQTNSQGDQI